MISNTSSKTQLEEKLFAIKRREEEKKAENLAKKLGLPYSAGAKDLVLLGTNTLEYIPKDALAYPGRLFVLEGGFEGWQKFALSKPVPPSPKASAAEREAYQFKASLHAAMTGMKPAPPPAAAAGYVPTKRKKKGGGCS